MKPDMKSIKQTVLTCLHKSTSQMPMTFSALMDAVFAARPQTTTDEFESALEKLCDAAQVRAIRGQRGGYWQNLYWPIVAPVNHINQPEVVAMSEPKNSLLNRLILLHGPIAGGALAEKARATGANIPAKNVPGLLETLVRKGEVIVKKHQSASYYMTPNQAADWDENVSAAGGDRDNHAGAHVMSAAPVEKQSADEITTNSEPDEREEAIPEPDAKLLAMANATLSGRVEDLENSLSEALAYNRIAGDLLADLEELFEVEHRDELIPRIKKLLSQGTDNSEAHAAVGRLALLLIDSAELTEIEELDKYDAANAQQRALRSVEQGHAARAVVVRILGEARRQVEWKEAA